VAKQLNNLALLCQNQSKYDEVVLDVVLEAYWVYFPFFLSD